MKEGLAHSWRIDWLLGALALVFAGLGFAVVPYFARLAALTESLEAEARPGEWQGGLYLLAGLFGLGFFLRLAWRWRQWRTKKSPVTGE
ncbi:MAG: hypothetical protein ACQKBY_13590 [Verrucomicrobiales bacterium]